MTASELFGLAIGLFPVQGSPRGLRRSNGGTHTIQSTRTRPACCGRDAVSVLQGL